MPITRIVTWVFSSGLVAAAGLDYLAYKLFSNAATLSRVLLGEDSVQPLIAVGFTAAVGELIGHLYFPTLAPIEAVQELLCHVAAIAVPVLLTLGAIVLTRDGSDSDVKLLTGHQLRLATCLASTFAAALWLGHRLVPQHVGA